MRPPVSRGFTLVEALVASAVLSAALIGVAAGIVAALASAQASLQRGGAVLAVASLAASMHANPAGWSGAVPAAHGGGDSSGDCVLAACGARDMAARDLRAWRGVLASRLPGARGEVSCSGGICVIVVNWGRGQVYEFEVSP